MLNVIQKFDDIKSDPVDYAVCVFPFLQPLRLFRLILGTSRYVCTKLCW